MIPKYLKIKGLYSYQTEQEIDFEPLTDASLFGIFGAVGSGKSSILEAITFALYGDTERLNKSGDDRTYNMMNLRSDDLLIDFECIAGKKGDRYRFTVKGKRNNKNFKEVKTFERKAYIWQENAWIPLPEGESAEDIIGLSYDNFRRTIIIPQGRFQEFIELKDAERTRMMKELFQLEKYDLSRHVGSLAKQNDIAISNVEGQLLGLGEVTPEMIGVEEKRREDIRVEIKKVTLDLAAQQVLEAQYQKLKLTSEKILMLREQLAVLEGRRDAMQKREETLKMYEICSLHFRSIFDQKRNLTTEIGRNEGLYKVNFTKIAGLAELLSKEKEVMLQLKPQYEKRQELVDTAEELEKVLLIIENKLASEKRKEALERGDRQLREKEAIIDQIKIQRQELEKQTEILKSGITDVQELSLVATWFSAFDNLSETRRTVKLEADALQAELTHLQAILSEKIKEVRTSFLIDLPNNLTTSVFQEAMDQYLIANQEDRKRINKQIIQINTTLALHQYAGNLEEGVACPLCGSEHHPAVLHADEMIENELALFEKHLAKLDQQEKGIRGFVTQVERIFTQIENLEKQKSSIKQRYADSKAKLDQHEKEFVWTKFNRGDRQGFEKHFEEISKLQSDVKVNEANLKALAGKLESEVLEKTERIEKPLQVLKNEILRLENTVVTLSAQLQSVNPVDFEGQDKAVVSEKISLLKKNYKEVTALFEQTEKQVDALEKEKDVLSGSQQTLQHALENNRQELSAIEKDIAAQLVLFGFESESTVAEILSKSIQIDFERKEIDQYKFALETTGRDLQNLITENSDASYDPEKHATSIRAKELLSENLQNLQKEEGGLDRLLKKMAEDLAKRIVLLNERERLRIRKEHLDDLAKLFRSSGFVDYASSIYLQNLIQAANHRFHRMTHQQLHLELGEGNSFWVRDLLNGGHLRLLKTLSGGQKFQAALSLALALADHIHVRNESTHNFFFLDEGFGSLDKNALQTVFETLKSLRKENRIVGIISHVEDLQQEIQTYLRITESEEGSLVAASWK